MSARVGPPQRSLGVRNDPAQAPTSWHPSWGYPQHVFHQQYLNPLRSSEKDSNISYRMFQLFPELQTLPVALLKRTFFTYSLPPDWQERAVWEAYATRPDASQALESRDGQNDPSTLAESESRTRNQQRWNVTVNRTRHQGYL